MTDALVAVVTTIQAPTPSMETLSAVIEAAGGRIVVVGDRKGPDAYALPATEFLSLQAQRDSGFSLGGLLPTDHYTRKNLGYLVAIRAGAQCIYETDDDNAPNEFWRQRDLSCAARDVSHPPWLNVYRLFGETDIWPRGLPLTHLQSSPDLDASGVEAASRTADSPVQQSLANGSADVDAIWRLVLDRDVRFEQGASVRLDPGTFCPFNSQTTWWWPQAYRLLYLPSHCTFRMTDIWRSFVAQRCLWELGTGIVFHAPDVHQVRNQHDLMADFRDEVPGYLLNAKLVDALAALDLIAGDRHVAANMTRCYETLVSEGAVAQEELELLSAWLADVEVATAR